MMCSFNVFDIASMAMSAQSIRLSTIASNMANVDTVSSSKETAYKSIHPSYINKSLVNGNGESLDYAQSVVVDDLVNSSRPNDMRYDPHNPKADEHGYVYLSNVNIMEEMADMIAASRSFQSNSQLISTGKELLMNTINMGR